MSIISYFRDRLRNSKPWFKYVSGVQCIEGQKTAGSGLILTIKFQGEWISIAMDKEAAHKLAHWMSRSYPPGRGSSVVDIRTGAEISVAKTFPIRPAPGDPGPSPGPAAG